VYRTGSRTADERGVRTTHAATALAAFIAGLTAAATVRRVIGHRLPVDPAVASTARSAVVRVPDQDAVVLPFVPRVLTGPAPEPVPSPARCGDSGGRTKAGAPCGTRTTTGGRCHHHPMAA
jgi:hypothetical protein